MRKLTQRTEAVVNLRALEHNVKNIRARLGSGVEIMAVLKGDGYGLTEAGVDQYGVNQFDEATVTLGTATTDELYLQANGATKLESAEKLNTLAKWGGVTQPVHIKIDTGMSRIGFPADESAVESVRRISEMSNLEITGAFTHFSRADEPDGASAKAQFEK